MQHCQGSAECLECAETYFSIPCIIKFSLNFLPLFHPYVKPPPFCLSFESGSHSSAVWSSDVRSSPLWRGLLLRLSFASNPRPIEKYETNTATTENFQAFCAIYLVESVCSFFFFFFALLVSSLPPPSHWGLTSLLGETTVISRVVCVCLNVRVC